MSNLKDLKIQEPAYKMTHQSKEEEMAELRELTITLTAQVTQYKAVCESQQAALTEKNTLLEQFQQLNNSLKADLDSLKKLQADGALTSASGTGFSSNPWDEATCGREPEQFRMLFVGNLSYETTDESLTEHFKQFGEVEKANVKTDSTTKKSRGFGFVVYKTCAMVDNSQKHRPHILDSRKVDTKRALPKEDGVNSENILRTNDLFVGGLSRDTTEEEVRAYFEKFGNTTLFKMPTFADSGKSKGFAFLSFEDYDIVDKLVLIKHHTVGGFRVEVKKRLPTSVHMGMKEKKEGQWGNQNKRNDIQMTSDQGQHGQWGNQNKRDDYSIGYNSNNRGFPDNKRPRHDFSASQNQFNRQQTSPNMSQPPPAMPKPPSMNQQQQPPPQQSSMPQNPMDIANMPNVDSAQAQALAAYFSTLAQASKPSNQSNQSSSQTSTGYNQSQGYNQGYNN